MPDHDGGHDPVRIIIRDDDFVTEQGDIVDQLQSEAHQPGTGRKCIHAIHVPNLFLVAQCVLDRINWQPRIIDGSPRDTCIASMRSGLLTLAFDTIGAIPAYSGHFSHREGEAPAYRYDFIVRPVWFDDDEEPDDHIRVAIKQRLTVANT